MKTLYLIRHGIAQHNVLFDRLGKQIFYDERYYDTSLTNKGHEQSLNLGRKLKKNNYNDIDLVLTSTLTRCLESTYNIFKDFKKPIIALDILKEYPQGLQTCNKRDFRDNLIEKYPLIDFSFVETNPDLMWNKKREESLEELVERIRYLNKFIYSRPEKNIVIVSHSSFLGQYKDGKFGLVENGEKELLHCHPYKYLFSKSNL